MCGHDPEQCTEPNGLLNLGLNIRKLYMEKFSENEQIKNKFRNRILQKQTA